MRAPSQQPLFVPEGSVAEVRRLTDVCRAAMQRARHTMVPIDITLPSAITHIVVKHQRRLDENRKIPARSMDVASELVTDPRVLFCLAATPGNPGDRLRVAREAAGLQPKLLAALLDRRMLKQRSREKGTRSWSSLLSQYAGGRELARPHITMLADELGTSALWLRWGTALEDGRFHTGPPFLRVFTDLMNLCYDWLLGHYAEMDRQGFDLSRASLQESVQFFCQSALRPDCNRTLFKPGIEYWPWCFRALRHVICETPVQMHKATLWDMRLIRAALTGSRDKRMKHTLVRLLESPATSRLFTMFQDPAAPNVFGLAPDETGSRSR